MKRELIECAKNAAAFSYSPYSHFTVGAALYTVDGKIYTGCNVESVSFSPTVCAERTAIVKAVSGGARKFAAIAIVGGKQGKFSDFCYPCGVCRQQLSEFAAPQFEVVLWRDNGQMRAVFLHDLLPNSFCSF